MSLFLWHITTKTVMRVDIWFEVKLNIQSSENMKNSDDLTNSSENLFKKYIYSCQISVHLHEKKI